MADLPAGAKFRTLSKRHQGRSSVDGGGSSRRGRRGVADEVATLKSGMTDMDRWLERVFDQALDGNSLVDLDDEGTLTGRLKGGGDNPNQPSTVRCPV